MYELTNLKPNGIYDAYVRRSRADVTLEEVKKIDTLKQHEKYIKQRAAQLNITIRFWYKEVVSGDTITDRPEVQKMLKNVESGEVDGILVVDVDRLARGDTTDQGIISRTFKYTNTKIITLMKIYDPNNDEDEDFFEFNLFMARKEYKQINKRLQRGRINNVLEGKFCASTAAYGYTRVKIPHGKGFTLEEHPKNGKILQTIFLKRYNGMGVPTICNYLNDLGIPSPKGDIWTPSTIISILTNPIYLGKIRWNHIKLIKYVENGEVKKKRVKSSAEDTILVEGLHPRLISDEVFYGIEENKTKMAPIPYDKEMKNPLAGLVKCHACGRVMIRNTYASQKHEKVKNNLNIENLQKCLREHKGPYSLSQLSQKLGWSKNMVVNRFTPDIKKFIVPKYNEWLQLKALLKIPNTEFDEDIKLYYTTKKTNKKYASLMCPRSNCSTVSSILSLVETKIIELTKIHLDETKKILDNYVPKVEEKDKNVLINLEKQKNNLKSQLEKAFELVEKGIYTPSEFADRSKKLKIKISKVDSEINKIKKSEEKQDLKPLIAVAEKVIGEYYNIKDIETKNTLLKSIIYDVYYIRLNKDNLNNFELKINFKF